MGDILIAIGEVIEAIGKAVTTIQENTGDQEEQEE